MTIQYCVGIVACGYCGRFQMGNVRKARGLRPVTLLQSSGDSTTSIQALLGVLQDSNFPAVFSSGHHGIVMDLGLIGVDDSAAVQNLCLDSRRIAEFNRRSVWRVEERFHLVPAVNDACGDAILLLVLYPLRQFLQRKASKVLIERSGYIFAERVA